MSLENTMPADDTIELRVLHGPQAGARLPLQHGRSYTIGTSDACTVVLVGAQVAQEHAQISVDATAIMVEPLQGQVLSLTGQAIEPGPLPLGTVLQFGLVKLTAAPAGDEWPDEEALQVRNTAQGVVPEIEEAEGEETSRESTALAAVYSRPSPNVDDPSTGAQRGAARRYAIPGAVILLALAAAFAAVRQSSEATASPGAAAPGEQEQRVKLVASDAEAEAEANAEAAAQAAAKADADRASALAEAIKSFPASSLELKRGDSGSWVVGGRLQTEEQFQQLREQLSALHLPIEYKVMLDAERLAALERFVQKHRSPGRLELRSEPGDGKVLRIVGSASSAAEAASFSEHARRELAALEPIELNILRPQQVRELFMERLRDAGLGEKFSVVATEPALELRASLSSQETRRWEALFLDFTRLHGSTLKISAHVEAAPDPAAAQVAAVVGGAFPYIVTTGGQRITPGGALGGQTVVSVRDGEIALADGTRVRYGP
ncbi:hypothetical protein GCM10023165_34070 [Variovorax defluvii]|uniref:EscD/YscD/HrpQ family type III secretion system inner membrane ring protein n=1 Tax=Variovorax defluvii TaxID=913761 RepID=A0ABP8HZP2_9BURK